MTHFLQKKGGFQHEIAYLNKKNTTRSHAATGGDSVGFPTLLIQTISPHKDTQILLNQQQ